MWDKQESELISFENISDFNFFFADHNPQWLSCSLCCTCQISELKSFGIMNV